jgi:four helix bundle protein
MATVRRFEDLEAWKTARQLSANIYELSSKGTFERDFALRDQMRRAAISVLSNIAEGFESRTKALFVDFLGRAKGSAGELRAQAYVALDVGHIDQSQFSRLSDLADKCSRQISNFISYLQQDDERTR